MIVAAWLALALTLVPSITRPQDAASYESATAPIEGVDADPVAFPQRPGAASGHHLWFATADPERPRRSVIHHVATDREARAVRGAAQTHAWRHAHVSVAQDRGLCGVAPGAAHEARSPMWTCGPVGQCVTTHTGVGTSGCGGRHPRPRPAGAATTPAR